MIDPYAVGEEPETRRRRRRGPAIGWLLIVVAVLGALVLGQLPSPYVVEKPGPVFNTLGSAATASGGSQRLIVIPKARTYPTSGALDLLTVSIVGSREEPLTWTGVALAWFDPSQAVVPLEEIYPEGVSQKESDEQGAIQMKTSQQEAVAAALRKLGYTVPGIVTVDAVTKDSAASGVLETGDEILTADGTPLQDATELRKAIAANGTSDPVTLRIRRDGSERDVTLTPRLQDDGTGKKVPLIGIVPGATYQYPIDVRIQLDNVGGPSAGMMFALGIIDKLTPGKLTGGKRIAGTGEIDAAGDVGPIGGIRQKMYGARSAGADYFLAPSTNCDEVVGHIPSGLTVYSVSTLSQALAAVKAIGTGTGRGQLATCAQK